MYGNKPERNERNKREFVLAVVPVQGIPENQGLRGGLEQGNKNLLVGYG